MDPHLSRVQLHVTRGKLNVDLRQWKQLGGTVEELVIRTAGQKIEEDMTKSNRKKIKWRRRRK